MPILMDLIRALQNAEVEVVDLTAGLSAETPLLPDLGAQRAVGRVLSGARRAISRLGSDDARS